MAKMIVDENGFNCNGNGMCGGSNFIDRKSIMECFHCKCCNSFIREGLKIIDKRFDTKLTEFI